MARQLRGGLPFREERYVAIAPPARRGENGTGEAFCPRAENARRVLALAARAIRNARLPRFPLSLLSPLHTYSLAGDGRRTRVHRSSPGLCRFGSRAYLSLSRVAAIPLFGVYPPPLPLPLAGGSLQVESDDTITSARRSCLIEMHTITSHVEKSKIWPYGAPRRGTSSRSFVGREVAARTRRRDGEDSAAHPAEPGTVCTPNGHLHVQRAAARALLRRGIYCCLSARARSRAICTGRSRRTRRPPEPMRHNFRRNCSRPRARKNAPRP